MITEKQIKTIFKQLHDDLSDIYYDGTMGLTKEEFDQQHGMMWGIMEEELIAEGYLTIPEPPRDLAAEMTNLEQRVKMLERGKTR